MDVVWSILSALLIYPYIMAIWMLRSMTVKHSSFLTGRLLYAVTVFMLSLPIDLLLPEHRFSFLQSFAKAGMTVSAVLLLLLCAAFIVKNNGNAYKKLVQVMKYV